MSEYKNKDTSEYKFIDTYPDTVGNLAREAWIPVSVWGEKLLKQGIDDTVFVIKGLILCILHCNDEKN